MDALPMAEANDLPYRSHDLKKAHMCGHDGHTVCLLGLVPFFMKNIGKIPSDKVIRLLFQPSE
jgi:hippurate hydrolase